MATPQDLYACLKALCDNLWYLRRSPRPVDIDWRRDEPSLNLARERRDNARQSVDACLAVLDAVAGQLPDSWLGDDPQISKYIRLKRSLETMRYFLNSIEKPYRVNKMPMAPDDDPADVANWNEAERAVGTLGDDLKDWMELAGAKEAHANAPRHTGPLNEISMKAKALAALVDHPDWTDKQIAHAVGCHTKSLYRWKDYTDARRLLKERRGSTPRGSKDPESGIMEAWDDDRIDDDRE